jgi:hypothetical protein
LNQAAQISAGAQDKKLGATFRLQSQLGDAINSRPARIVVLLIELTAAANRLQVGPQESW